MIHSVYRRLCHKLLISLETIIPGVVLGFYEIGGNNNVVPSIQNSVPNNVLRHGFIRKNFRGVNRC